MGGTAVGPGISIDEALASNSSEPLLVNGTLVADATGVRLCSVIAESYPPMCGGSTLRVEGLDLDTLSGLTSANGVIWSDGEIQLLGRVQDGVLTVTGEASG